MALVNKRITELPERLSLQSGDYVAVDGTGGTAKYQLEKVKTTLDATLTQEGQAAEASAVGEALEGKVNVETGKSLTSNDFTDADKSKLDGIEAQANKTVIDSTLTVVGQAADAKKVGDEITDLKSDLDEIAQVEKWNLLEGVTPIDRLFLNADGTTRINYGTFYYDKIPISPSTIYYFYNEQIAQSYSASGYDNKYAARTVLFHDSDEQVIAGASVYTRSPITAPANAAYISICGAYINGDSSQGIGTNWLTTKGINEHQDTAIINAEVPMNKVDRLESELTTINHKIADITYPSVQLENRKPTFTFIFDDGTDGDVNTKALFDSFGFKCGFALIGEATYLNPRKERYLSYQNEGFEILSHSVNATAFSTVTDLTTAESYLKNSQAVLKENGFDVKGWVTPSTWMLATQFPLVVKYYQYGYGHLDGTPEHIDYHAFIGKDIRQLDRWGLEGNTVEQTLAKIDDAIANNTYMILYGHSYPSTTNNMTVENMNTILSYLKAKVDNNEIIVDTPNNTINNYYSFRHSDLLDLYNAINA